MVYTGMDVELQEVGGGYGVGLPGGGCKFT